MSWSACYKRIQDGRERGERRVVVAFGVSGAEHTRGLSLTNPCTLELANFTERGGRTLDKNKIQSARQNPRSASG
eukprot:scaffold5393_cov129-Isochrysis_galbana.AAC.3